MQFNLLDFRLGLDDNIPAIVLFIVSALVGTFFAYCSKWSWENVNLSLAKYMFGDKHAFGRVLTTLAVMCASTGGLDLLSGMTQLQVVMSGIGLGTMVPSVVAKKLENYSTNSRGDYVSEHSIEYSNSSKSNVITREDERSRS